MRHVRLLEGALAVLLAASVLLPIGGTAAVDSSRVPRWRIVAQHVDPKLGDVIGLDGLSTGDRRAHALTRRAESSKGWDNQPAWSPDGRRVAFVRSHEREGLYVVTSNDEKSHRIGVGLLGGIFWSPDGSSIAYSRAGGVFVVPSRGGKARLALPCRESSRLFYRTGSWSPDGRRLALVCDDTIWIVTADGSSRRRLSRPADGLVGVPSWSPNGSWIAYGHRCYETEMHGGDVFCDVAVARPDGTARRTVVRRNGLHGPSSSPPVWSSEGNLLVAEWGYGSDILLVDPRSGVRRKVCSTAGWNLTAGRSGTFAFVDGTLDIFDARGRRLLRRSLPRRSATT